MRGALGMQTGKPRRLRLSGMRHAYRYLDQLVINSTVIRLLSAMKLYHDVVYMCCVLCD
jgi:hypothetical protein